VLVGVLVEVPATAPEGVLALGAVRTGGAVVVIVRSFVADRFRAGRRLTCTLTWR
jgi:hypothetical protein